MPLPYYYVNSSAQTVQWITKVVRTQKPCTITSWMVFRVIFASAQGKNFCADGCKPVIASNCSSQNAITTKTQRTRRSARSKRYKIVYRKIAMKRRLFGHVGVKKHPVLIRQLHVRFRFIVMLPIMSSYASTTNFQCKSMIVCNTNARLIGNNHWFIGSRQSKFCNFFRVGIEQSIPM